MKFNILVTGCGGDIGQSIGKILKSHSLVNKVIGCDLSNDHAGKFIFDKTFIISGCRSNSYLDDILNVLETEMIDLIIPVSEPELRFYSEKSITGKLFNRPVIIANQKSLEVGFDKLLTSRFLEHLNLPFPVTNIITDLENPIFPLILKSRAGSGSKSLFVIKDSDDFDFYSKKFPDFIAQQLVGQDDAEYTCGLFRSEDREVRDIIYKRRLVGGFSGFGSVEENSEISHVLAKIAEGLDLKGSINVQLRISEEGPCVFEINPRFSSTVKFRQMMGFDDVIWSIQNTLGLPLDPYIKKNTIRNFYKGYQEYVD